MTQNSLTPAEYISQFVSKVTSDVPSVQELRARLALMASIPNAGIDVEHDTEAEAISKLAKAGITGDKIPLSENQQLAKDYKSAALNGTESELVKKYQDTHNPSLNKLLDTYVIESKIRSQALEMPNRNNEALKLHSEAFGMVITRVQENMALTIETGAQLQTNGIKPTEQERAAILQHLEKAQAHPDSKALSDPNNDYEPTL